MPSEEVGPTSAAAWAGSRKGGMVTTLPSGNTARLRRTFSIVTAMENGGDIPNPLLRHLRTLKIPLPGGSQDVRGFDIKNMSNEDIDEVIAAIQREVVNVFVEPKVVLPPEGANPQTWTPSEPDVLSIVDVSWDDQVYAYQFGQGAVSSLTDFRNFRTAMESLAHGAELPHDPQQVAENQESLPGLVLGSSSL